MRIPTPDEVAAALAARPVSEYGALPGRTNHLRAGVLVPLRWFGDRLDTVVTLRPAGMVRHGAEVSFAGGRPEPEDTSLEATALREAREELGLVDARVLGRLSSMPVYTSDFRLEPFVAQIAADATMRPDPGEVEAVLPLDLTEILRGGHIEAVDIFQDAQRFQMPIFRPGGHIMFGATAITLLELITVLAELSGLPAPELTPSPLDFHDILARKAHAGR